MAERDCYWKELNDWSIVRLVNGWVDDCVDGDKWMVGYTELSLSLKWKQRHCLKTSCLLLPLSCHILDRIRKHVQSDPGPLAHTAHQKPGISNRIFTVTVNTKHSQSTQSIHRQHEVYAINTKYSQSIRIVLSQHKVHTLNTKYSQSVKYSQPKQSIYNQHKVVTVTLNKVFTVNTKYLHSTQSIYSQRKGHNYVSP